MSKKIVVSNIYGKYNLGDFAIRNSGLQLLSEVYPNSQFYLLCESLNGFNFEKPKNIKVNTFFSPYGYAIDTEGNAKSLIIKLFTFLEIIATTSLLIMKNKLLNAKLSANGKFAYVKLIKDADVLVLMGGGYLVSKSPLKDLFGICLNALPLVIGKIYGKKIIILPISYGPYASKIHDWIIGSSIKDTITFCRDKISLKFARKYNKNAAFMPDLALYEWPEYKERRRESYYVLTIKDYLNKEKQRKVEREFSNFIKGNWDRTKHVCYFIPTAANPIEENDLPVGERIAKNIKNDKIFKIVVPKDPSDTKRIIQKAQYAICTRMHSAIFSTTEFTPFVTVAYEHKSTGLLKVLDIKDHYTKLEDISSKKLTELVSNLTEKRQYVSFIKNLKSQRKNIIIQRNKLKNIIKTTTE